MIAPNFIWYILFITDRKVFSSQEVGEDAKHAPIEESGMGNTVDHGKEHRCKWQSKWWNNVYSTIPFLPGWQDHIAK